MHVVEETTRGHVSVYTQVEDHKVLAAAEEQEREWPLRGNFVKTRQMQLEALCLQHKGF